MPHLLTIKPRPQAAIERHATPCTLCGAWATLTFVVSAAGQSGPVCGECAHSDDAALRHRMSFYADVVELKMQALRLAARSEIIFDLPTEITIH